MGMFDLLDWLRREGIHFVLVGGLAVALRGYARVTMDVDIVLAMDATNLERFIAGARAIGLRPTIPVPIESLADPDKIEQWHRDKGMLAFSLRGDAAGATALDVLVKPVVPYHELRRDAQLIDMGSGSIPVASIAHLIKMKSGTGRSKDAIDIEELRRLQGGGQ